MPSLQIITRPNGSQVYCFYIPVEQAQELDWTIKMDLHSEIELKDGKKGLRIDSTDG